MIDYSVLNELERIRKPFVEVVQLGRMVVEFVGIVKCASKQNTSATHINLTWPEI